MMKDSTIFLRFYIALVCAIFGLYERDANAWTQPIVNVSDARSPNWTLFSVPQQTVMTVSVTSLRSSCDDRIQRAPGSAIPPSLCDLNVGPNADIYVHLFLSRVGEVVVAGGDVAQVILPMRCRSSQQACTWTGSLAAGTYGILLHGGPEAQGYVEGTLTVGTQSAVVREIDWLIAGNIAATVGGTAGDSYDIHGILLPDATNMNNDYLGVEATELWLLDSSGIVRAVDMNMAGVGAGALLRDVERLLGARSAGLAVLRPWSPPSLVGGSFVLSLNGVDVPVASMTAKVAFRSGPLNLPIPLIGDGAMRMIINQRYRTAERDPDGDGLSTAIEDVLGLCNGLSAIARERACNTAQMLRNPALRAGVFMDPRDTDGDGVSDGAEVLGSDVARGTNVNPTGSCGAGISQVQDADQTFPLWAFNPLHKDVLIEIDRVASLDRASGGATITSCSRPTLGCRPDGAVLPQSFAGALGEAADLLTAKQALLKWRAVYAAMSGVDANNPDGLPGIAVHFDVRIRPDPALVRHSMWPDFLVQDEMGRPVIGMVAYIPGIGLDAVATRSGSQCSCAGATNCADPKHGGYSLWGAFLDASGGGSSEPAGFVSWNSLSRPDDGLIAAHEMGHVLGGNHASPYTFAYGTENPFFGISTALSRPDSATNGKIVFRSLMNYAYSLPAFSNGSLSATPIPRLILPGGQGVGYFESLPLAGLSTEFMQGHSHSVGPTYRPFPIPCVGDACQSVDFDGNGQGNDLLLRSLEGQDGTTYLRGSLALQGVDHYWCNSERAVRTATSGCCSQGTYNALTGACTGMGVPGGSALPDEALIDHTMVGFGSPTSFVAGELLFNLFVDDADWASARPTRRCSQAEGAMGLCTYTPNWPRANEGVLRWFKWDGFSINRRDLSWVRLFHNIISV